jgi:hypothetical protein
MVKNAGTAKKVSDLLFQCSSNLNESARLMQVEASDEEFRRYRRSVGAVMGELLFEVLNPLFSEHPELKPQGFE